MLLALAWKIDIFEGSYHWHRPSKLVNIKMLSQVMDNSLASMGYII
jgi:hypothetical protein